MNALDTGLLSHGGVVVIRGGVGKLGGGGVMDLL